MTGTRNQWKYPRNETAQDFNPCKDFVLNVNLDKCMVMKISQEDGKTEKIKP
jgi:hypothetical protein